MTTATHDDGQASTAPAVALPRHAGNALLRRVAAGDRDALGLLYDLYAPAVHGAACRLLLDPAHAEQVTHDVFLEVWRSAPTADPTRGSAATWLLTLAHRHAVVALRRELTHFDEVSPTDGRPAATSPRLARALGTLPPRQREAIALAYVDGLTCSQVAERLAEPRPVVQSWITEGLRRVALQLGT